jgi:hypothetical protein
VIQDFIQSIQSQLRNYSSGLRQMNNLVDIPWTMVDGDLNIQRLIFQRDHTLLIIKEGVIQESRWEYLPSVNSIDMTLDGQRVLMNEVFSNGTALILKKDGNASEFYAFVNANNLPTLNLEEYLRTEIQSIEKNIEGDDPPPIPPDDPYAPIILILLLVLLLLAFIIAT